VHGSGSYADVWSPVVEGLARSCRVIAYDRRGFARSSAAPRGRLADQARDAAELLEALSASPATVVGWSAGGVIALDLAASLPRSSNRGRPRLPRCSPLPEAIREGATSSSSAPPFSGNGVAIDSSGRIVVAGGGADPAAIAVARYEPDGRLDKTFGTNGKATTEFPTGEASVSAVAIDPAGRRGRSGRRGASATQAGASIGRG
jgi:pimeloyl-ACP methyl ester carboxylesterase